MKVLIIGLGSIAKKHINALNKLNVYNIHALRSTVNSESYGGVKNIYTEENFEDYDFFLISNPTFQHFDTIKNLIIYKKPIFVEKPLFSQTGSSYLQLVKEIEERNLLTYVGCNLRFLKSLQEIKKLFPSILVNEINIYCGSYLPDWRPGVDFEKVYSASKEQGGGVHIDLIHELDYLYWIAGPPIKTHSIFRSKSSLNINAIDYAHYNWEFKNFSANITLNYYRRNAKRTFEIVAEDGTYLIDLLANRITKNNVEIFASDQKMIDTYYDQMEYFIDRVVNKKKESMNNVETAYNLLKLCIEN